MLSVNSRKKLATTEPTLDDAVVVPGVRINTHFDCENKYWLHCELDGIVGTTKSTNQ
jgi:hypothetical protein